MMRSVCDKRLVLPPKNYSVPKNDAINLIDHKYDEISVCQTFGTTTLELFNPWQRRQKKLFDFFFIKICVCLFCKMDSLKIEFGINHYKCRVIQVIKVDF